MRRWLVGVNYLGRPKHLGAQIGVTLVLHTWGSALTHHPHVHGIVAGGGLSADGDRWVACKPGFLCRCACSRGCSAAVSSNSFIKLIVAVGCSSSVSMPPSATRRRSRNGLRRCASANGSSTPKKCPFAGPAAALVYLSRYTHRVAISNNQRLLARDARGVTFRWKDYRATGKTRHKAMTLDAGEFMRRFLLHVLSAGFHRIRHYGLLANAGRRQHLAHARKLLHVAPTATESQPPEAPVANVQPTFVCPHCGAAMIIIEIFTRGEPICAQPTLRAAA